MQGLMNARTLSRLSILSSLLVVAAGTVGCGRLRPNRAGVDDAGSAATFTAVAPAATQAAPTEAQAAAPTEPATALPTAPPLPTATAQPTAVNTLPPQPTAVQHDTGGDALDTYLNTLGNGAADDSAILTELEQIP